MAKKTPPKPKSKTTFRAGWSYPKPSQPKPQADVQA